MPIARFEMPDGRIARFEVPEGTTPEQAQTMMQAAMPKPVSRVDAEPESPDSVGASGNMIAGLLRGAGSIGSTLIAPYDMAKDAIAGKGLSLESNRERRHDMDMALSGMGADIDSTAFGAGKLAAEVAGTAGVPATLAKGAMMAGATPKLVSALGSGGMSLGGAAGGKAANLALRAGAGAASGGVAAGLVDPDQAGAGAAIGAASYPAIKGAAMIGRGVKTVASDAITNALGMATGTGAEAVKAAFAAGKNKSGAFLDNLMHKVDMTAVLDDAKQALDKVRADRAAQYRQGMFDISNDKTIIDVQPIIKAMSNISGMGSYKGQQINKNAAGVVDDLSAAVNEWAALPKGDFHTPEGLDALKRKIGDIRETTQHGTSARVAADRIYNSIKSEIAKQAPTYNKVMKDYADASEFITEVQRAFSLRDKTSADTAMRKLQSLMRNNVNTNYGNRLDLAKELERAGGKELMPALAGQAMSSLTPRGMMGPAGVGLGGYAALTNPAALPMLAFGSPRLVGGAAYGAGRMSALPGDAFNAIGGQGLLGAIPRGAIPPASLLATLPAVSLSR